MRHENLIFTIPLNEVHYRKQLDIFFKNQWKNGISEIKRTLIYLVIAGFLTYLTIKGNDNLKYIFFGVCLIFLSIIYVLVFNYFKSKKTYKKKINEFVNYLKSIENHATVELSEEAFSFKNKHQEFKTIWETTNYQYYDSILILNSEFSNNSFMFDEIDLGPENFQKLESFVKQKSKPKS